MATSIWLSEQFEVYGEPTTWHDVGGVYIFAGVDANNRWSPLYVGQAASFKDRLSNHERWSEAKRRGATHIHAHVASTQTERDRLEAALVSAYQPPLNTQLR